MRVARLLSLALSFCLISCVGSKLPAQRRYDRKQAQTRLKAFETPGLVIGEFTLARKAVVDGDTIHVEGLDNSLRLVCVDTEETFKTEKDRRLFEEGWETYPAKMRGGSPRPVKMATPMGEEAKKWAIDFFADVKLVRLERDHPKEIRDYYNRYLAYVFAFKDGVWVNYNVEAIRAGMGPYFTKYGYSRRFHAEFVQAQREAQQGQRGIWDPAKQHYPDYDERLPWWDARGEFLKRFEQDAEGKADWIVLTNWDAITRLEAHEGKEVTVIGAVSEIRLGDKGPTQVMLSRKRGSDFPVIFFDKDVFLGSGISDHVGEYVRVRGVVNRYKSRSGRQTLQIIVNLPGQVTGDLQGTEERP